MVTPGTFRKLHRVPPVSLGEERGTLGMQPGADEAARMQRSDTAPQPSVPSLCAA